MSKENHPRQPVGVRRALWAALAGFAILLTLGCGSLSTSPTTDAGDGNLRSSPITGSGEETGRVLTIGDVAKDSPSRIFKEYSALAAYLGAGLQEAGIAKVEVVVAKDLDDIAKMVNQGELDVYFGNTVNAVMVARQTGALPILRQWKRGAAESYSVFLVKSDSGITDLNQLVGSVISFQAPHSGSGYLLPRAFLQELGFSLTRLESPDYEPGPAKIGYINTTGERTSIELLSTRRVEATVVGDAAYRMFPFDLKESLDIIAQSQTLPKNLVYVRPGFDPQLTDKISEIMTGMHRTEEGRKVLLEMKKTTKFDLIPPASGKELVELKNLLDRVSSK